MLRIAPTMMAVLLVCQSVNGQGSNKNDTLSPPIVPPTVNPSIDGIALTITGPATAAVGETVDLIIQGLPPLDSSKTLSENFAWAIPNADGETVLSIDVSTPIDGAYKIRKSARIPLPLTNPPIYDAEIQFKAESQGLYVIIVAWTSSTSRIAHHRIQVGPGPGPKPPGPEPPGPPPEPEPSTDLGKYIKALAESVVTTGTVDERRKEAASLAANFLNVAERHEAAGQAVTTANAIAKVEDGVKEIVRLNQAALGSRVSAWESFSTKYGEYLSKLEANKTIPSTIFGRAAAYRETAKGLQAAWSTQR